MKGVLYNGSRPHSIRDALSVLLGSAFGLSFMMVSIYLLNEVLPGRSRPKPKPAEIMSVVELQPLQTEELVPEVSQEQPHEMDTAPPPLDLFDSQAGAGSAFDFAVFDSKGQGDLSKRTLSELSETSDVSRLDEVPRRSSSATIEFPKDARKRGLEGFVTVNLLISRQGRVLKSLLVDSRPKGVFDTIVLDAAKKWAFTPPTQKGEPVQVWLRQTVRFDLQERQ